MAGMFDYLENEKKNQEDMTGQPAVKPGGMFNYLQGEDPTPARARVNVSDPALQSPDKAADDIKRAERLGVPKEAVEGDPEFAKQQDDEKRADSFLSDAPKTTTFLADPENASVASDDIENLSFFERLSKGFVDTVNQSPFYSHMQKEQEKGMPALMRDLGGVDERFNRGFDANRYGVEAKKAMDAGNWDRVRELNNAMNAGGPLADPETIFGTVLQSAGEIAGSMVEGGDEALSSALGGGVGAALAASLLSTPVPPTALLTVPGAFIGGSSVGFYSGMATHTMDVEAGHTAMAAVSILDEYNIDVTPDAIRVASYAVGLINAGLEVAGFEMAAGPIKDGIMKMIKDGGAKAILKNPAMRDAFMRFFKNYGKAVVGETSTEVMQELTQLLATQIVATNAGTGADVFNAETAAQTTMQTIEQVAPGMLLFGLGGSSVQFYADTRAAAKAEVMRDTFAAMGENAQASKLRERLPAKYEKFVESVTKDGPIDAIYVDSERFTNYWERTVADPNDLAQVYQQLGVADQIAEARNTKTDIRIPLQFFQSGIAGTEHLNGLIDDLKFAPDAMSYRQAQEFREQRQERIVELQSQFEQEMAASENETELRNRSDEIYTNLKAELIAAGRPEREADVGARMNANVFGTMAAQSNLDPVDLYNRYGIVVTGGKPIGAESMGDVEAVARDAERAAASPAPVEAAPDTAPAAPSTAAPDQAKQVMDVAKQVGGASTLRSITDADITKIKTDAERFQFKSGADGEGVSKQLQGVKQWQNSFSGVAIVYEDTNGEMFVVDGHQRFGLARRLYGEGQRDITINAVVLKEKDGWTPEQARRFGAMKNLAEGGESTTAIDIARVFREGEALPMWNNSYRRTANHTATVKRLLRYQMKRLVWC
jgi:hypothetical protein